MKYKNLKLFFVATLVSMPALIIAQEKSEEVTIIAPYNPSVSTAQKINRNPRINYTSTENIPTIEYSIQSERINTSLAPETPKPSRVPGEPQKDLFRSHLRAGFGNYMTPYFELWVNSLQSESFNAGAHLRHLSSFGEINDYAKSNFSNTLAEAYISNYFNENTFGAKISYRNNMVHRYGFMPDDYPTLDIPDDSIKQVFQKVGFYAGIGSNKPEDDAFNYYLELDGHYFFDKYESTETRIDIEAGISKKMDLFNNDRSQELGLDLGYEQFFNKDSINSFEGGIFSGTPFIDMDLSPYRIMIGIKADYRIDSASKVHIYPVIEAEASLLEEMLVVYAGIDGGLERNSYASLSEENPFINSVLPLNYTNNKFEAYGGVKGRVKEVVDYDLNIAYRSIGDMPLFVNDTSNILGNTFNLTYDDANLFRFNGELGFRSKSVFGLLLGFSYNAYSMDKEEKAWHRPALELKLETFYVVKEKLTLKANITSRSGVYARTFNDNGQLVAKQLDGWFDIGLGGEYQINKQFSAFINFNNLLNNDYMRWYNYPVQKLNVLAGVGFSF